MKEFNQLCKEIEEMDSGLYADLLADLSGKILPALAAITQDGVDAISLFSTFILGSVVADGKLSEEEFILIHPLFNAFFGADIDFESCKKLLKAFKKESRELKNLVDLMVDVFGMISDDLKADIISVCLMICAVDGKVSLREKQWIMKLAE